MDTATQSIRASASSAAARWPPSSCLPATAYPPVTFFQTSNEPGLLFWLVADVAATRSSVACTVAPVYADIVDKTPHISIESVAEGTFGPNYPAQP